MGCNIESRVAVEEVDRKEDADTMQTSLTDTGHLQPCEAPDASNNNDCKTSPALDSKTEASSPPRDLQEPPSLPPSILNLPKEILPMLNGSFTGTPLPASLSNPLTPPTSLLGTKIQWEGSWYRGWEPKWGPIQPDEKNISKVAMPFLRFCGMDPDPKKFSVLPFHQGMWNKLYLIKSMDKTTDVTTERIFRIPLPVNPWFKMQSEVATMEYVRLNTSIPIPKVYVFDSSMENDLGFEWMIMEKIDGQTFADVENSMSREAKERFNTTIADWVHELSMLQFDVIGSLYRQWDPTKDNYLDFRLGPVTTDYFLGPWRTKRPVFKGPFRNEAELYRAVVILNLQDILDPKQKRRAKRAWASEDGIESATPHKIDETEDDFNCGSNSSLMALASESSSTVYSNDQSFERSGVQQACFTLLDVLPLVERRLEQEPRKYILHHFDISRNNVLLNNDGDAIVLLDWENIATKSLSQVQPWPSVIDPTRYDPPELWQESVPKPSWYLRVERDYITRLVADVFMSRLKKLQSPWPQVDATGAKQNGVDVFEEDLGELGAVAERIYVRWGETEICDRIREKCGEMFLPIAAQAPGVTLVEEHQASARYLSLFCQIIPNPLRFITRQKGDVQKRSRYDGTRAFKKAREVG